MASENWTSGAGGGARNVAAVNGLRGLAILLVVVHHLFIPYFIRPATHVTSLAQDGLIAGLIRNAWLGVDIFFVLSGFVLYLPYAMGERAINSRADIYHFYRHRARRLMPLYFIVVLIGLAFHSVAPIGSMRWLIESGGLVTALFVFSPHGFMPPSNILLWSVGVEFWFSVLFPFLVMAIARFGIVRITILTTIVCLASVALGHAIAVERVGQLLPLTTGLLGSAYKFMFGMLVCKRYVAARAGQVSAVSVGVTAGAALAGAIGAVAILDGSGAGWLAHAGTPLFDVGFALFFYAILVGPRLLSWPFERWWLQLLGCMCYSVYAWHGIILNVMIPPASELDTTWRLLPDFVVLTLALSALSYRYIEFGARADWRALFLLRARVPS